MSASNRRNDSFLESSHAVLREAGGPQAVVDALRSHPDNRDVLVDGMNALFFVMKDGMYHLNQVISRLDANRAELDALGVLSITLEALQTLRTSPQDASVVLKAIDSYTASC